MYLDELDKTPGTPAPALVRMIGHLSPEGEFSVEEEVFNDVTWGPWPLVDFTFKKGRKTEKGHVSARYKIGAEVRAEGAKLHNFEVVLGERIQAGGWDWLENRDALEDRLYKALQKAVAEQIQLGRKQLENMAKFRNNRSRTFKEHGEPSP